MVIKKTILGLITYQSKSSKNKAEAGGYNNLSVDDLICNICYNRCINYDSHIKPNKKSNDDNLFKTNVQSSSSSKLVELEAHVKELQQHITILSAELENITRPVDTNNLI
ncbi:14182_t:CDS:2, partial [Entrophospora sp. SA101]